MTVKDIDQAIEFFDYILNRHQVYERRQEGWLPEDWSGDPILQTRKFTNVYRVLDYGSQFLLKELLEPDLSPRDTLFRCFLYRHTGRWEAWEFARDWDGLYPTATGAENSRHAFKTYRDETGKPVFTNAYLVYPQSSIKGTDKLDSIFDLAHRLLHPDSPDDIVPAFLRATTQQERFSILRSNKGVADFMSMQILTDWGYSVYAGEYRENDFVVAGPGARRGAKHVTDAPAEEAIQWAFEVVQHLPNHPVLGGRPPSLMDIQNCYCEFSKYVRFQLKPVPEQAYTPAHPGPLPNPVLPEHW